MIDARLAAITPSTLLEHDDQCCRLAQSWFHAVDAAWQSRPDADVAPTWIRRHYQWGPTRWPLYWCEAVRSTELDCGALAALALVSFATRMIMSGPVQLIEAFSHTNVRHWQRVWQRKDADTDWIAGEYAYHEACAVYGEAGTVRIFDPTDNIWLDSGSMSGYGAIVALRFGAVRAELNGLVQWGQRPLRPETWEVFPNPNKR